MTEHSSIRHGFALALWKTALSAPAPTMFALACGQYRELLAAALQDAERHYHEPDADFDLSQVQIQLRRVVDRPAVLIQLPPPFSCPDPHFMALVLDKPIRGPIRKSDLEGGAIEFFTLEESPSRIEHPPTMLCKRDADGTHHNLGAGPDSSFEAFCDRLKQLYTRKAWWRFW